MEPTNRSPRITDVSWGRLEVEGEAEPYKDAKLFPGGSRAWNWRETKTAQQPGIQIAGVQELLDHGARVVVLSRGMAECLHVPRETLDFFEGTSGGSLGFELVVELVQTNLVIYGFQTQRSRLNAHTFLGFCLFRR